MTTPFHAKHLAFELTKRLPADRTAKLSQSLANASVDLNAHQVEAALFAFRSPLSRGAILADEVGLGKTVEAGLIVSQFWAHLKRDFTKLFERGGASRRIGKALLDEVALLFLWWHKLKEGEIQRSTFQKYVAPLRERVWDLLLQGAGGRNKRTAGTCFELLEVFPAMWTYMATHRGAPSAREPQVRSHRPP